MEEQLETRPRRVPGGLREPAASADLFERRYLADVPPEEGGLNDVDPRQIRLTWLTPKSESRAGPLLDGAAARLCLVTPEIGEFLAACALS